ncbi:MAG: tRNA (N6-threonylcarbamoyladenosine(37)-N6)-methyltransferase TrmO [Ruminococcaceae bacterium]|nr:tRNA (N6-threonylcarbamoyladenosine(37)-N6)-methyltransferase TrmO [Oscillospiraceae bacterium]
MADSYSVTTIAHIHNGFCDKFGIPRQSGLVPELSSTIIFTEPYRSPEALRGIEGYSHLWLLWQFSACTDHEFRPTVRPPRLGGNKRMGVFATRSPYRPNNIGLSSVLLESIEMSKEYGPVLHVSGADLMNGTPILDIKPYIAYTDSHPNAVSGFADDFVDYRLKVDFPASLLQQVEPELQSVLYKLLENDPRPAYQQDAERIYTMDFAGYKLSFFVADNILTVTALSKTRDNR